MSHVLKVDLGFQLANPIFTNPLLIKVEEDNLLAPIATKIDVPRCPKLKE